MAPQDYLGIDDWHQKLLRELITAPLVSTRIGMAYASIGHLIKFDLTEEFPATKAKKLFFGQVKRELYCFLKGQTSLDDLHKAGVTIWDDNAIKKNRNDIGPIYGWQWRHWNGIRVLPLNEAGGFDQLRWAINELIQTKGTTRRAIVSAWNAHDVLGEAAVLPPCHVLFQFNMIGHTLYTDVYQRSADAFLGLPFDVASFAVMSRLVANELNLSNVYVDREVLNYHISNLHLYEVHKQAAEQELSNEPGDYKPFLTCLGTVDEFSYLHCELNNYDESRTIKAELLT